MKINVANLVKETLRLSRNIVFVLETTDPIGLMLMSYGQSFDCPSRAPQPVLSRSVSPSLIETSSIYSPALSLMIEVIYRAQSRGFQLISFLFFSLREA